MNLLKKLTIKNLKLNKKRTIVTIIGIMLSVALITAVATIYSSMIKSLIKFETYQKGHFHVAFYDVPISELSTIKNNRGIENIYLTDDIGYAKLEKSKNEYKPYIFIKGFTKESLESLSVKLVDGQMPKNENEILIPTHLKTNGRVVLNIGDTITLDVGKRVADGYELTQDNPFTDKKEKIIDTVTKTYKIVGIIERPATNIEGYSAPGYTFITYMDETNMKGNVNVYAKYNKKGSKDYLNITANILGIDSGIYEKAMKTKTPLSEKEQQEFANEAQKAKYQIDINSYLITLENNPFDDESVGSLGVVVAIVCGIIIVTSVFCIKNSFDISITEKIKQYGMLRSIGATKKQIKNNVFYEATILGIIGIPFGLLLGFMASCILIIVSNIFLSDMLSEGLKIVLSYSWISFMIAIILGLVTIYLSALRSARKASRVTPIDSIRNSADIKINSKKIKSPKFIMKVFGIGGEISYKNLKRNKKKYRTTVISIAVSVLTFIALSSFMNLAFEEVENELKLSDYNISLSANNFDNDLYQKFHETTKFDNILDYAVIRQSMISFKNDRYNQEYVDWLNLKLDPDILTNINLTVLGDNQYHKYIKSLGLNYNDMKDKAILLDYLKKEKCDDINKCSSKTMRVFDFKVGDVINGKLVKDKDYSIEIGYIAKEEPFGLKNMQSPKLIISDELFDKIVETKNIQIYYLSNNASKLQDDIDSFLSGENYNLDNIEESAKMMNNFFTLIGIFLYGFIIVISLIGITNIFNTITTNMELRKQEFAMLKSIGMTKKEFSKMIRLESIFMGLKSLIFGIPIGIGLSYLIYHLLNYDNYRTYNLPLLAILMSILVVFMLISIIMKYSINKISKQNTIETIRNENI